jgi:hypothetical protein
MFFWNAEGAEPAHVSRMVHEVGGAPRSFIRDIWAMCGVHPSRAEQYLGYVQQTGAADYAMILGSSGASLRSVVYYNKERLQAVRHEELDIGGEAKKSRAPLAVEFRDTAAPKEEPVGFVLIVAHLNRHSSRKRMMEVRLIRRWALKQELPVILVGNMSFHWDVRNGAVEHDDAFDVLVAGDYFQWLRSLGARPSRPSSGDGTIEDFVFRGGAAKDWQAHVTTLHHDVDGFVDKGAWPGHVPILFDLVAENKDAKARRILAQIEAQLGNIQAATTNGDKAAKVEVNGAVERIRRSLATLREECLGLDEK